MPATAAVAPTAAPTIVVKAPPAKSSAAEIIGMVLQLLLVVAGIVLSILGRKGYMKWTSTERWQRILGYADVAFNAVEALVEKTDNEVDDKLLEFFRRVNAMLKDAGRGELSADEQNGLKEYVANKALEAKLVNGVNPPAGGGS
jgi:hypothetical protein